MFSKTEVKFLKGIKQVDNNYERVLNHRILSKLHQFEKNIPLLLNNEKTKTWFQRIVTENSNIITDFCNSHLNENKVKSSVVSENNWCGGWDSNPRSPEARDLESCAFSLPAGIDLALPPPPPPLHFPCPI